MLLDKLQTDLVSAMKSHNQNRVNTLRFLISGIQKFAIDNYPPSSGKSLTDDDAINIVKKQIKDRKESILAFTKGGRDDLVAKETSELVILEEYAPTGISGEEIRQVVKETIAQGTTDFGKIMNNVMGKLKGQAEGGDVAKIVKEELIKQ